MTDTTTSHAPASTEQPTPPGRTRTSETSAGLGLLALRLVAGGVLTVHGVQNLLDAGGHVAATARFGIPFPQVSGWLSMLGEAGLGLLLVLGLLTRVAGALAAFLMGLTYVVVHLPQGLVGNEPGVNGESALLLGVSALTLALVGPGAYALDRLLLRRRPTR